MKTIGSVEDFNSCIKRVIITKEEIDAAIKRAGILCWMMSVGYWRMWRLD